VEVKQSKHTQREQPSTKPDVLTAADDVFPAANEVRELPNSSRVRCNSTWSIMKTILFNCSKSSRPTSTFRRIKGRISQSKSIASTFLNIRARGMTRRVKTKRMKSSKYLGSNANNLGLSPSGAYEAARDGDLALAHVRGISDETAHRNVDRKELALER
jgi:hypothetical protein